MSIIKHGNNALSNVTALPSAVPTGKPVLLSTASFNKLNKEGRF